MKRVFDFVVAALGLVLLMPAMLIIGYLVARSSPGGALFVQARVGRSEKTFDCFKFRTMAHGAPVAGSHEVAASWVTPIGKRLRSLKLDELPQLFNVLRGDMSLVGPRPERPEFVELFRNDIIRYGDRHRVKSGITGWAQVHGLCGQTSLAERVEWDNYYIAHWSLGLDLKILALTVVALFRNAG